MPCKYSLLLLKGKEMKLNHLCIPGIKLSWEWYIWFVDILLMNFELMFISKLNCFFTIYQFSCSVMFDPLWPHGLQNARLPCPSPTPGAYSNSCPLSRWCYQTISSSLVPFSFHLQSFPASGSLPMSQFFTLGGQSIGASTSASALPMYCTVKFKNV